MRRSAFLAAALSVYLTACIKPAPPSTLGQGQPIAVAILVDNTGVELPVEFQQAIHGALDARGLSPKAVPSIEAGKNQAYRLNALDQSSASPYVLLVESQATYFSQIAGRFRWTVQVNLALSRDGGEDVVFRELQVPVFLQFSHQKEGAALIEAAPMVARQLGELVDELLAAS